MVSSAISLAVAEVRPSPRTIPALHVKLAVSSVLRKCKVSLLESGLPTRDDGVVLDNGDAPLNHITEIFTEPSRLGAISTMQVSVSGVPA